MVEIGSPCSKLEAADPEPAENTSLQVTALVAGTVTGRVISRLAPVPTIDRPRRAVARVR